MVEVVGGGFQWAPEWLRHHDSYCSYADTIMPQFFFAVGFAYRLTFEKRFQQTGAQAYFRVFGRVGGLALLAVVLYGLGPAAEGWSEYQRRWETILFRAGKREVFQTLMHIAVTTLWITPVIRCGVFGRLGWGVGSVLLHWQLSRMFYFDWCFADPQVVDGGPLGFLTWTIPMLGGTLACDLVRTFGRRGKAVLVCLGSGCVGVLLGWLLTEDGRLPMTVRPDDLPYVYGMMSQRAGTPAYLIFATGISFLVYTIFLFLADGIDWRSGLLRTFGSNPLATYVLHGMVDRGLSALAPSDSPWPYVLVLFGIYLGINYVLIRGLERQQIFLKL